LSNNFQNSLILFLVFTLFLNVRAFGYSPADSTENYNLPFPYNTNYNSGLFLNTPSNLRPIINYDILNNQYLFNNRVGEIDLNRSEILDFNQFQDLKMKNSINNYWRKRTKQQISSKNQSYGMPKLYIQAKLLIKFLVGIQ